MTDQTQEIQPVPQQPEVKSPEQMLQDVTHSVADTANSVLGEGTVDNLKSTATQVAGTVSQVTNVVAGQVSNLSEKVGWEELVGEVKDIVTPISSMITNILKIAFFMKSQQRISRGQYIIGSLSAVVIVWLIVSVFGVIVGPIGVWLWSLLIVIPLLNLAVKRFHDLNKPGRWSVSIIIPFVGWIMPALFKGVNENNTYGPDPLIEDKTDLTSYVITGLSLFILSSIVTTILGFLGFRVSEPEVDVTDPNMIGNQVGGDTSSTLQKGQSTASQTIDSSTKQFK